MGEGCGGLTTYRDCSEQRRVLTDAKRGQDYSRGGPNHLICLRGQLPFVTTSHKTSRAANSLHVFTELGSVQGAQLKCLNDGEVTVARDKGNKRKGQNDNDHHVPETKPGSLMPVELL